MQAGSFREKIKKAGTQLASTRYLIYLLPVLMLYVLCGTIAQKYIGLYRATQMFFSDAVIWLGPVPLPGFPIILVLITVNLAAKIIFKSPWMPARAGTLLSHIGVLLLLSGGLLTSLFSQEGYMDLTPGQAQNFFSSYHHHELAIIKADHGADRDTVMRFDLEDIKPGTALRLVDYNPDIGAVTIMVLNRCANCRIVPRGNADDEEIYYGMAQHMALEEAPLRPREEDNLGGVTIKIDGTEDVGPAGVHVVLEDVPKYPRFASNGHVYDVVLRQHQNALPFQVELLDFSKEEYPGTEMARSYESKLRIMDGPSQWESTIRMNEPLRYKGYTFYQSSFIRTPQGERSVLAVVWNAGRSFPYLAGFVICAGLLLHFILKTRPWQAAS